MTTVNKKKALRQAVYDKYAGHCSYCGQVITIKDMQVDHLIPKAHRGYTVEVIEHIDNLMPSCRLCNHYKRAHTLREFREHLLGGLRDRLAKQYTVRIAERYGIVTLKQFDLKFYFEREHYATSSQ